MPDLSHPNFNTTNSKQQQHDTMPSSNKISSAASTNERNLFNVNLAAALNNFVDHQTDLTTSLKANNNSLKNNNAQNWQEESSTSGSGSFSTCDQPSDLLAAERICIVKALRSEMYEKNANGEVITRLLGFKLAHRTNAEIIFQEEKIKVQFKTDTESFLKMHSVPPGTVFVWEAELEHAIHPDQSSFSIRDGRIEITFKKKDMSKKWTNLLLVKKKPLNGGGSFTSNGDEKTTTSNHLASKDNNNNNNDNTYGSNEDACTSFSMQDHSLVPFIPKWDSTTVIENPVNVSFGLTGLRNIGNTCFLNAALQVLLNTSRLKEYFLNEDYRKDVNGSNPLGCNGNLATATAQLFSEIWSSKYRSCDPHAIKAIIGAKFSQFAGFGQQDAQEFLSFLLDGLHEDLNRVVCKPLTPTIESNGRPDQIVAEESWKAYLSRNDSIIVDLFHGQLRSRLVCPECKKISVTFDPFVFLSLPFPKPKRKLLLYFWPLDINCDPQQIILSVPNDATVEKLIEMVRFQGTFFKQARLVQTINGEIVSRFDPQDTVTTIRNGQLHMFETVDLGGDKNSFTVDVVQKAQFLDCDLSKCSACCSQKLDLKRCKGCFSVAYCNRDCQEKDWYSGHKARCNKAKEKVVGQPFVISIDTEKVTMENLRSIAQRRTEFFLRDAKLFEIYGNTATKVNEIIKDQGQTSFVHVGAGDNEMNFPNSNDIGTNGSITGSDLSNGYSNQNVCENSEKKPKFFLRFLDVDSKTVDVSCAKTGGSSQQLKNLHRVIRVEMVWYKEYYHCFSKNDSFKVFEDADIYSKENSRSENLTNLFSLLEWFSEAEQLEMQDSWYCAKCKIHREAEKTLQIWKLPSILILHLKRFSFSGSSLFWRSKIDAPVNFPLSELDMIKYLSPGAPAQNTIYDLYGLVSHSGSSYFGHYISYARLLDQDNGITTGWRRFDDSLVEFCNEEDTVDKEGAYLLFYKRRD